MGFSKSILFDLQRIVDNNRGLKGSSGGLRIQQKLSIVQMGGCMRLVIIGGSDAGISAAMRAKESLSRCWRVLGGFS
jgi:hypothetical protein